MEGNKKPTGSSIADELFGRKDSGRSPQSGLFGSIFPAPSSGVGRDALQSDLFGSSTSRRHATTDPGHSWSAQSTAPGSYGNSHGSPSKTHTMPHKDGYSGEALNTCNLSSSLYYGGQDICSDVSSVHGYGTQYMTYEQKKNGEDDSDSSNMASRGNWWQGSLYY